MRRLVGLEERLARMPAEVSVARRYRALIVVRADRFGLDELKLQGLLEEALDKVVAGLDHEERHEIVMDLELFLVAHFNDSRFYDAPTSELLAWLIYLAGTYDCLERPPGFTAKSIIGHSVRGPDVDDALLIRVVGAGRVPIWLGPFFPEQFIGEDASSNSEWVQRIIRAVEEMLAVTNKALSPRLDPQGSTWS